VQIQPLTRAHGDAIATWRYPDEYSTYDANRVVTSADGYWAVVSEGELFGFCCFGLEARVPGVDEEQDTLDVGYGMRPDLVGKGLGRAFVAAIVDFAADEFSQPRLRLLILTWNLRSRKVAEGLGFRKTGIARSGEGDFLVMTRRTSEPS
jgi:[ribosomal protein S18]-alanine N-acetyltransferase